MPKHEPLKQRLEKRLVKDGDCLVWTGATTNGYGVIGVDSNHTEQTHRVAYKLYKGEIPQGYQIDHLCMNRRCCNPDHLEAVTQLENLRRENSHRWSKVTSCKRGHPFTSKNSGWTLRKDGRKFRYCRTCHNLNNRAQRRGMSIKEYLSEIGVEK